MNMRDTRTPERDVVCVRGWQMYVRVELSVLARRIPSATTIRFRTVYVWTPEGWLQLVLLAFCCPNRSLAA